MSIFFCIFALEIKHSCPMIGTTEIIVIAAIILLLFELSIRIVASTQS